MGNRDSPAIASSLSAARRMGSDKRGIGVVQECLMRRCCSHVATYSRLCSVLNHAYTKHLLAHREILAILHTTPITMEDNGNKIEYDLKESRDLERCEH